MLLSTRRFLPLFLTQFLGAMNDNLLKNALVMLVTYKMAAETGENAQILVTLAAGIFILPFFLFSATAGQVADKYDRSFLTQIIKQVEIGIMVVAAMGFYFNHIWILMISLFAMGVHSTFFGPIKYALLPQHLQEDELLSGNAYIEAGTFLAILAGTIFGGILILETDDSLSISAAIIAVAVAGFATSRFIPEAEPPAPKLVINKNIWEETLHILSFAREKRSVFYAILGISWFWLVGATFLSQFPTLAKDVLHAKGEVVTLFLTLFSVGIACGAFLCNKLLKGHIQTTYVPLGALGITVFGIDLYFAAVAASGGDHSALLSLAQFISQPVSWRLIFDLFVISVSAGMFIVPLYALMQHDSEPEHRARVIAANNVLNALFMVIAAVGTLAMLSASFTIPHVFLTIAILNGFVTIWICRLLPDAMLRAILKTLLSILYRVEVNGLENYKKAGKRVLIIANHTSFLDAALIASFLPEKVSFAVNSHVAKRWWMQPVLSLVDALPLDPTNPLATKGLIDRLKEDRKCMIFPEGRITITGALMKIYEGPGMIADKAHAKILPIRIDGAQFTPFSRLRGKMRLRWFPKITLTLLPPCSFELPEETKGRERRHLASAKLYDVMSGMMFETSNYTKPIFASVLDAMAVHGELHPIMEDVERKTLTYLDVVVRSFALARVFKRNFFHDKHIALMLPNTTGTVLALLGLQVAGKTPAMLNFSSGAQAIQNACKAANLKHIVTSSRFVEMAKLESLLELLQKDGLQIHYLEEIREQLTLWDKISSMLAAEYAPLSTYERMSRHASADDEAIILFTSGTEGAPKGVVLSHTNIQANRQQVASRIDFGPQDIVFNALPMFHSFGLTGGTLLPLLSGIKSFYYPSPLHYRIVPELIYDTNATILFGTDTFLSGYAKFAHPYDLHSIRYVFAGAEKLKESTRKTYADIYGVRIFEGYGATETAPVLAINTPMHNKAGTVGRLLPSIEHELKPVPGIEEGGQLWVKGPNIMKGYFKLEKPGELQPPTDGWYDTGDIVDINEDGYVSIKGRTKRFAKIGGEMVSLSAVENAVNGLWKEAMNAAVNLPDDKKGEQIILLTTQKDADKRNLQMHLKAEKLTELAMPKTLMIVKEMPLLGTGKVDYQKAKLLAEEKLKAEPKGQEEEEEV